MRPWMLSKKPYKALPPSRGTLWGQKKESLEALGPFFAKSSLSQVYTEGVNGDIVGCEYLASYTMLEGPVKTILVPGRPPKWTPLQKATTLEEDKGEYWRDENTARFPRYTMEPAVASIFHMNPSFEAASVDIVTCASVLGSILSFCMGASQPQSFVVHMIGKTAFFLRRNKSPEDIIANISGYGKTFLETYTTWDPDVNGSASHQRIMKYSIGGLQMLVRSEVDAYNPDMLTGAEMDQISITQPSTETGSADEASLIAAGNNSTDRLSKKSSASTDSESPVHCDDSGVTIREIGSVVPQKSLIEIKTRADRLDYDRLLDEQMPRMWLRQLPGFVIALHDRGRFNIPEPMNMSAGLMTWAEGSSLARSRMVAVLKLILKAVAQVDERKIEVRGDGPFEIEFRRLSEDEATNWDAVSKPIQAKWASSMGTKTEED